MVYSIRNQISAQLHLNHNHNQASSFLMMQRMNCSIIAKDPAVQIDQRSMEIAPNPILATWLMVQLQIKLLSQHTTMSTNTEIVNKQIILMFHCPHQELIICFIWNRFSYFQLCMQCHLSIPFEIKDATTLEMGDPPCKRNMYTNHETEQSLLKAPV